MIELDADRLCFLVKSDEVTGKIFEVADASLWNFAKQLDDTVFGNVPHLRIQSVSRGFPIPLWVGRNRGQHGSL